MALYAFGNVYRHHKSGTHFTLGLPPEMRLETQYFWNMYSRILVEWSTILHDRSCIESQKRVTAGPMSAC